MRSAPQIKNLSTYITHLQVRQFDCVQPHTFCLDVYRTISKPNKPDPLDTHVGYPMTPEVSRICQALFLDRDGVINVDSGYVHRTEDFQFLDGIFDIARDARRLGFEIIVVTNQSGIGRGYYTEDQFFELTRWMLERFAEAGAPLTAVYHCPFHLDARVSKFAIADHPWRKPNPGMLMAAAENHGVSLEHSLLIGDRASDLRAAISAKLAMCCLVGDHMNIPPDLENTALVTVPSVLALSAKFKDLLADLKQP